MRKYYLDNLRYGIVLLVVFYHIVYIFNSIGVVTNVAVVGIPELDSLLYLIYPWFMPCLFLISGISARYALERQTRKSFIKNRLKRLLLPSVAGIFILGWINGYITSLGSDIFANNGDLLPGFVKYFIYSLIGIGPLWFAHELFLASLVLLLLITLDKKDKIWRLTKKTNIPVIAFLFLPVWGSSMILNTPVIEVYRNGIYIFMFLLGYYIFSHEHVINVLEKFHLPLLIAALICGISYTIYYYGQNYTTMSCLTNPFTNLYLWLMTLAALGCGKAWFDVKSKFTIFMAPRSFGVYVLHYPILILFAYLITTYLDLPTFVNYIFLLLIEIILVPLAYELISRVPILSILLLGKSTVHKIKSQSPVVN